MFQDRDSDLRQQGIAVTNYGTQLSQIEQFKINTAAQMDQGDKTFTAHLADYKAYKDHIVSSFDAQSQRLGQFDVHVTRTEQRLQWHDKNWESFDNRVRELVAIHTQDLANRVETLSVQLATCNDTLSRQSQLLETYQERLTNARSDFAYEQSKTETARLELANALERLGNLERESAILKGKVEAGPSHVSLPAGTTITASAGGGRKPHNPPITTLLNAI